MAIKEKDLWHNFFNFRMMYDVSVADFEGLLRQKCTEYHIPMDVYYDHFFTGKFMTKDEGTCAVIFNPDSPKGSLRYCILTTKTQYSTLIQGWKLYNTSNTIPKVPGGTTFNDIRVSLFGGNRAEQEWNTIMDRVFEDLKREVS